MKVRKKLFEKGLAVGRNVVYVWAVKHKTLSHRFIRQPVEDYPGIHPTGEIWRTATQPGNA